MGLIRTAWFALCFALFSRTRVCTNSLIGRCLLFERNRCANWTRGGGGVEGHGSLCLLFAVLPLRQHLPRLCQRNGCAFCRAFRWQKRRGLGDRGTVIALHSTLYMSTACRRASRTSAAPLAGQCLPCQDGSYILGGGGKECTPCPSGSGFCPGKNIVIPKPGHWQAQRCRSA